VVALNTVVITGLAFLIFDRLLSIPWPEAWF